jgi:hypothetical protein
MRVLLDQGTPVPLRRDLPHHAARTAFQEGRATLANGDLLTAPEAAGFDVFVTTDTNLRYKQDLSERRIAMVVLRPWGPDSLPGQRPRPRDNRTGSDRRLPWHRSEVPATRVSTPHAGRCGGACRSRWCSSQAGWRPCTARRTWQWRYVSRSSAASCPRTIEWYESACAGVRHRAWPTRRSACRHGRSRGR